MHRVDFYSTFTKNCSGPFTEEEVKNIRAYYYAMCAEADAMLGKPRIPIGVPPFWVLWVLLWGENGSTCASTGQLISALRETQLLNTTVVIFTADHGELAMEHRQFYKMSMFEGSSHVPLLFMGPGVMSGVQVNQLVSLVDVYPTVLGEEMDESKKALARL